MSLNQHFPTLGHRGFYGRLQKHYLHSILVSFNFQKKNSRKNLIIKQSRKKIILNSL